MKNIIIIDIYDNSIDVHYKKIEEDDYLWEEHQKQKKLESNEDVWISYNDKVDFYDYGNFKLPSSVDETIFIGH